MTAEQFFFFNIVQEKMGRKKASREATARDTSVRKLPQEKLKVPPPREDFPAADVYQNRVSLLKKIYKVNLEISQV